MPARTPFAEQLRRYRKALDLTQRALAARAGYAFSTIRKLETGELRPSRQLIVELARALSLDDEATAGLIALGRQQAAPLDRASRREPLDVAVRALPVPATPLLGREAYVAELGTMLADPACRLITVVGPGGVGKTRVALAAAHAASFGDGAVFVPLAAVSSAELLPAALLSALDVVPDGAQPALEAVLRVLDTREMLLVLDNLEHLVDGWPIVNELLQYAPALKILATSRERLALQSEWVVELDGLACPGAADAASLETHAASQLFVQRLRQGGRRTPLSAADRTAVKHICELVEGLPLAIELAAMAAAARAPSDVVAALSLDLHAAATPLRDGAERHRSLWATCEYSWQLLTEHEQRVFAALAVFKGGWDAEAAQDVAGASSPVMAALVNKSLVRRAPDDRYDLHEILRQFATLKLADFGATAAVHDRHLAHYLALARDAAPALLSPQQAYWSSRLTVERDNVRAALGWAVEQQRAQQALELAAALWRYWDRHGPVAEGLHWLQRALRTGDAAATPLRAEALSALGFLAAQLDAASARENFEQSLATAKRSGDRRTAALALLGLGRVETERRRAAAYARASLRCFRKLGDRRGMAWALTALGDVARFGYDHDVAAGWYRQSLELSRELGDAGGVAWALGGLAEGLKYQRDSAAAGMAYRNALELFRGLGDRGAAAWMLGGLGDLALLEQDIGQAAQWYEEALSLLRVHGHKYGLAEMLANLGQVAIAQGQREASAELLAESLALFEQLGNHGGVAYVLNGFAQREAADERYAAAMLLLGASEREAARSETPRMLVAQHAYERLLGLLGQQARAGGHGAAACRRPRHGALRAAGAGARKLTIREERPDKNAKTQRTQRRKGIIVAVLMSVLFPVCVLHIVCCLWNLANQAITSTIDT